MYLKELTNLWYVVIFIIGVPLFMKRTSFKYCYFRVKCNVQSPGSKFGYEIILGEEESRHPMENSVIKFFNNLFNKVVEIYFKEVSIKVNRNEIETPRQDKSELIKIREDAIKIQQHDLDDTIKSIENENIKSSYALGFSGVLFGIVFTRLAEIPLWEAIVFLVLLVLCIVVSLWNMAAKKIKIHLDVDEFFRENTTTKWEDYLYRKHLGLLESYNDAKKLLYKKAMATKISFTLLVSSSLFLVLAAIKIWR